MRPALPFETFDDPRLRGQRRALLMADQHLTGLDRVEWRGMVDGFCRLSLHFLPSRASGKAAIPHGLKPDHCSLLPQDGVKGQGVRAVRLRRGGAEEGGEKDNVLFADFPSPDNRPASAMAAGVLALIGLDRIDPFFSRAKISSVVAQDSFSVPSSSGETAEVADDSAPLNYLAKDYQSFLQLMFDRLAVSLPAWQERHPADMGNMLVEILAYAADSLSYYQDAVATEAYLGTARQRPSVRRHARLLDYRVHEGCASRVWLRIKVSEALTLEQGFRAVCDEPGALPDGSFHVAGIAVPPGGGQAVFETMADVALHPDHESMPLYGWGIAEFTLRRGATSAVLEGSFPHLAAGEVVILAVAGDADKRLRHAVRLDRRPILGTDPLTGAMTTAIGWLPADALPIDLPVTGRGPAGEPLHGLAQAWGNIVPADAGFTVVEPGPLPLSVAAGDVTARLSYPQLIYVVPHLDGGLSPASAFFDLDPADAVPVIALADQTSGAFWRFLPDLLSCGRFSRSFSVECDNEGAAVLRFGDDRHGQRPGSADRLGATYRTGPALLNLPAETVVGWAPRPQDEGVIGVSNPLPAAGGAAPESIDQIRVMAPKTIDIQRRCVTPDDYVTTLRTCAGVKAVAPRRSWIGSRHTLFLHIQPQLGIQADSGFLDGLGRSLDTWRLLDGDVALRPPRYIPMVIAVTISVKPAHAPAMVRGAADVAVRALFGEGKLSFGESVYKSRLIAALMELEGVADLAVTRFQCGGAGSSASAPDRLDVGATEIACLDPSQLALDRSGLVISVNPS